MKYGMKSVSAATILTALIVFCTSSESQAGWLVSGASRWETFSFRPENIEKTPNYYGYGLSLHGGYSVGQVFDIALFFDYVPASMGVLRSPLISDARLSFLGIEFAGRIAKSVYFAVRGGSLAYSLSKVRSEDEVTGKWVGLAAGASIGGMFAVSRVRFWQASLDLASSGQMAKTDGAPSDTLRRFDMVAVSLGYTFNSLDTGGRSIFGDFLGSL